MMKLETTHMNALPVAGFFFAVACGFCTPLVSGTIGI